MSGPEQGSIAEAVEEGFGLIDPDRGPGPVGFRRSVFNHDWEQAAPGRRVRFTRRPAGDSNEAASVTLV
ncbi:MAG TPA: hypothetical protein VEW26_08975 [Allosphingosinicella sp.]|nr:hypothetical protein [Allosphingosinicella sp.]